MTAIKFNQPKYVIPLIIIPFNVFIFYMVRETFGGTTPEVKGPEEMNAINTTIPLPNLQRRPMKNKFDSFTEAYKDSRSYSSIQEIDRGEDPPTGREKAIIDSVNEALIHGKQRTFTERVNERVQKFPSEKEPKPEKKPSEYESQMQMFKDQMRYVDSLTRAGYPVETEEKQIPLAHEKDEAFKVRKISQHTSDHFNTIRPWKKAQFIQAMIDEEVQVIPGSRVRIRLLEDIEVNGVVLEKGEHLFGTVSAFKPQRVEITIRSILQEGDVTPVSLMIYDNDGLPGLYVPASKFREFTKDLASNMANGQNIQLSGSPENQMQMLYDMAEKAFSTATRTAGSAARKNKARLKYNTVLYLVNQDH